MRILLKTALAALIVVATYFALLRIAESKVEALVGPGSYRLAENGSQEARAFVELLGQLERWGEADTVASLRELHAQGRIWVAPDLPGQRGAVFASSLGLVSRIFVRRDILASHELPFPDLDVPREAQRTYATLRLAGTLYHELLHYNGLEDELSTYDREIQWYRGLQRALLGQDAGADRWLAWAFDSAIESTSAARALAIDAPGQ